MENFIAAIPSYQRAGKQATANYLAGLGIPRSQIFIFVQTAEDRAEYQQHEDVAQIIYAPADSVTKARNNILRHFGGHANILMMDDDIAGISKLYKGELVKIETRDEFTKTMNGCFNMVNKRGAALFGIYPVHNAFFMSANISTAVTVNTVIGFPRGNLEMFDESYKTKEDIELCARLLTRGREILRYNFLAANAKHRTNAGGCYDVWHSEENRKVVARLSRQYPTILAPHHSKPDEVRVVLKDAKIPLKKNRTQKG